MNQGITDQGLTLIELLIVIAVVGILSLFMIPSILSAQRRANDSIAMSCASSLSKAVSLYRVDHPLTADPILAQLLNINAALGADSTNESYMTDGCIKERGVIVSDQSSANHYRFLVNHTNGKNKYEVSDMGITLVP